MKNFTNNFKQFTSRLSARWLIMALMMLVGTSSAWAGMWINDNNGWNIEIERNGTSTWIGGASGFNREDKDGAYKNYSAENTTSLKIKNAWVKASSNDNWQIRQAAIYCRVSTETDRTGNFSQIKCKDYGSNISNANSIEFQIYDIAYDVTNGLAPGTYYLDYYFSVGNDGCDKGYCYAPEYNCGNTKPYCSNCQNCSYYSIKFKVPEQEKKYSLGGYIQVGDKMADKTTYYSTYDLAKQTDGTYKGTFSFSKSHNNAQYIYIVDNAGTIYGHQTKDYPMSPGNTTTLSSNQGNKVKASIALNTEYVFTFNPSTGAFTYSLACTTPDAPLIDGSDTTCPNVNYKLPTATNKGSYTQKWYNSNGTEVTSPVKVSVQTKYTTKLINGTCESDATEFTLNVTSKPAAPSIEIGDANICAGQETYILVSSPLEGYTYKLYKNNTEVNGATLNNENKFIISEAGSYTVKVTAPQTACGLTSDPSQAKTLTVTSVTLALDPTSAPICSGTTLANIETYVDITTNGNRVAWFEANSGGNALNEADEIRQATYYAEATLNGCTSERVAFNVTELLNVPAKPVITPSDAAICSGNTVTLTLTEKVYGETYEIDDIPVFTSSKTYTPTLNETTTYTITATNQCGSTNSEQVTINVTTTPTITGPSATQPNKEITLSSAAGANTKWETSSGSTLTPANGAETVFTATGNGNYTITARNTANNITCSATHEIVVNDKFYIYIRRPKSGDAIYSDWNGKTNEAEKGGAAWFKTGEPNYENLSETNYGGDGPLTYFEDCNGYIWDGYQGVTGKFYIHAPNTGGQDGYATFTNAMNVTSLTTDKYYIISSWTNGNKGANLAERTGNNIPTRIPEVTVPVLSIDPVSGIICQNAEATITVTNPEDGVTYTLNYEGKDQENPIPYTGAEEVKYTVSEAGTYIVKAETTSGTCKGNSSSSPKEVKVITTAVSFSQSDYYTTPWIPVTVQINVPKGYEYTYSDAALTSITPETDAPIKKANDTAYTYTFPRPTSWGIGNSASGDGFAEKTYTVNASIKNAEECGSATATVHLQDEGNDKCNP